MTERPAAARGALVGSERGLRVPELELTEPGLFLPEARGAAAPPARAVEAELQQ